MTHRARAFGVGALVLFATGCAAEKPAVGSGADGPGQLFVTSGFTDQVFVLDAGTGQLKDSIDLDRRPGERDEPHGITTSPDGEYVYVTLSHGEPSLWKIENSGLRTVGRLTLNARGASRVRLSPDGRVAAVPDYWLSGGGEASHVTFVRTEDLVVLGEAEPCAAPHDAVFSPDGNTVLVACPLTDEWVLLDATDYTVEQRIPLGGERRLDPIPSDSSLEDRTDTPSPERPLNVAWWNESVAFASVHRNGGTWRIDLTRGEAQPVMSGLGAAQLAISPDGRSVVTAHRAAGAIGVLTLDDSGREQATRLVTLDGAHPHGVTFGPNPEVVFVTWEGDTTSRGGVAAIDVREARVVWSQEVGTYTLGVTWAPSAPTH